MAPSPGQRRCGRTTALLVSAPVVIPAPLATAGSVIPPGDYQRVQLALGPNELGGPMPLAILPNRSVVQPHTTAPSE